MQPMPKGESSDGCRVTFDGDARDIAEPCQRPAPCFFFRQALRHMLARSLGDVEGELFLNRVAELLSGTNGWFAPRSG